VLEEHATSYTSRNCKLKLEPRILTTTMSSNPWPPLGDNGPAGWSAPPREAVDRPKSPQELGVFNPNGLLVQQTPEQAERSLRLLGVPFDSLPKPPFFAAWFTYTDAWHRRVVAQSLARLAGGLGRVPTTEEADAVAYYRARFAATLPWGVPLYLALTVFMVRRGNKTFRFPFYTPKPASFNPRVFPSAQKPWVQGDNAEKCWHMTRYFSYGLLIGYLGTTTMRSVCESSVAVNILSDPRLKQVREELRRRAGERMARDWRKPDTDQRLPPPLTVLEEEGQPEGQQPQQQPSRELSPAWRKRWQAAAGSSSFPGAESQQPQQQQEPQPSSLWDDDDSYLFDDASPVNPAHRTQPRPSSQSTSGGSYSTSWDQIRARAQQQSGDAWGISHDQHQQHPDPQQAKRWARQGESYTFSPEQEKAYAREQAQKEFDAMLERERKGVGASGVASKER